MAADIRPATQLEAAEFSAYVLDTENVETGLSVRNTLRLMAAAMAGELSGAAGTTITIRNAVADDKDRIIATVTSEGNRTAITYDLTDS
jgi:Na+(H+)/acetate symporter ActP